MLLQSCHLGVLRVFSFPLGLLNKLKSFSYFSEKCKSGIWYNWCSQRRLYRLCAYWFVRIEMCVLIVFMFLYSQHIALCFTENWAGFLLLYQFLAQDKAVVSAMCSGCTFWVSAPWIASGCSEGRSSCCWCRWFHGPSAVTVYCCVPVKAGLSWHLGNLSV